MIRYFWRRFWAGYYEGYDRATRQYRERKEREALEEFRRDLAEAMRRHGLTEKDRRPMAGRES